MKRLAIAAFAALAAVAAPAAQVSGQVSAQASAQAPDRSRIAAFADSAANAMIAQTKTPAISIAVVRSTDTLVMKGYGVADLEHGVPATAETVFRIGSLTKQVTAAAVLKLVEEGKLKLDGTIGDYLPEYNGPGRRVTIHQLLNHTSGIPSYTALAKFWERSRLDLTHAQMLELFAADSLQFAPGSRHAYNNSGYYILGMIVEKVSGRPYGEHVGAAIASPNALSTLQYCGEMPIIPHRAEGYQVNGGTVANAQPLSMNAPFAAGALCSTARDMVRWNSLLVGGRIISPASYAKMITPTTLTDGTVAQYGYGLAPGQLGSFPAVLHSGGINGFSAFMAYYPQQQLTIAVLTNSGQADAGALSTSIARFVLGVPAPPPAAAPPPVKDLPLTPAERSRYLGTYDMAPVAPLQIRVFEDGGRLVGQATGQGPIPLRYQGDHTFDGPDGTGIRMVFALTGDKATQFTLHQGGQSAVAKRVQE